LFSIGRSRGWRGITMTPKAVAQIERVRRGRGSAQALASHATEGVIAA
jgi:hypothetical protein